MPETVDYFAVLTVISPQMTETNLSLTTLLILRIIVGKAKLHVQLEEPGDIIVLDFISNEMWKHVENFGFHCVEAY